MMGVPLPVDQCLALALSAVSLALPVVLLGLASRGLTSPFTLHQTVVYRRVETLPHARRIEVD